WAVARQAGVPVSAVSALAVGEHGDSVFLFDTVRIDGTRPDFSPAARQEIKAEVQNWFLQYQALNSMRSSGWTSGENLAALAEELIRPAGRVFVCSAIMQGQYGISGVSLGVPVRLGPEGIREIVELPLAAEELEQLQAAARRVREMLANRQH
ncbi:MAG TPA: malate dehydrogenase, partial [Firmicutes bacterium]|nr:malate dehydrogenase [Bacillota bacterium]